jgi:signal transduction histidine kinase
MKTSSSNSSSSLLSSLFSSRGIKQKFITLALALLLLVAGFIAWFFPLRQEREMSAYLNQKAVVLAEVTAYGTSSGMVFDDAASVKTALDGIQSLPDVQFALAYNKAGTLISSVKQGNTVSYGAQIATMLRSSKQLSERPSERTTSRATELTELAELTDITIVVQPILSNGERYGTLVLGLSRAFLRADVARSRWVAFGVSAAILLLGGLLFYWQTTRLVQPLKTLEAAANHVAQGDLNIATVPVQTADEIGALTGVFNHMVGNLKSYVQRVEQQAAQIQDSNNKLQENNLELSAANEEIQRQVEIQAEQSREIELANSELQEKNLALDNAMQELKLTQSQLVQSERMNAAGMLTAGVMHEVNNPNAAVIAAVHDVRQTIGQMHEFFFSLLDERGKQSKKAQQFATLSADAQQTLGIALTGAERVKGIVANLQSYTKHQRAGGYESTIAHEIASTVEIFCYQFKKVAVTVDIPDTSTSEGNFGELNQVFLNLLVNAAQAGASDIAISGVPNTSTGGGMDVRFADNGKGMALDVQRRIFEPFFSTKGDGNSGLGLSISQQILARHGVGIEVASVLDEGTTFTLRFPAQMLPQPID